jgi:hypothetical protein
MFSFFDTLRGRLDAFATRVDGILNAATLLGGGRESDFAVSADMQLHHDTLRVIYRTEPYARRAVRFPVYDAWAKGYKITLRNGKDDFYSAAWTKERRRLRVDRTIPAAVTRARAVGASYIVVVSRDGGSPDQPLDLNTLESIDQFVILSGPECTPQRTMLATAASTYAEASAPDDEAPAEFSAPVAYRLKVPDTLTRKLATVPAPWAQAFAGTTTVHHSRVIPVINGDLTLTELLNQTADNRGESLIQIIFTTLARHAGTDAAAALLATEMRQHAISIPKMEAIKASDQAPKFEERMRLLKLGKTIANLIVLGKDETFTTVNGSVSGFAELREATRDALCAAVEIPETIFFGKSAGGMGGEPGIEADVYISLLRVIWLQLSEVAEALYRLIRAQKRQAYRGRGADQLVEIVPRELRELKPKDRATIRLLTAQADSINAGSGILPTKYLRERFRDPSGWRENLPEYDETTYPPPVVPPPDKSGGSPNTEGKNAPGQMPTDPTSVGTSPGSASGTSAEGNNPGRSASLADGLLEDL